MPVANLNLKDLYDTTVEFFALRSPTFSFRGFSSDEDESRLTTPVKNPVAKLQRDCQELREKLEAERRQSSACTCHLTSDPTAASSSCFPMRRDLDYTKTELAKSRAEVVRLEERCRILEKTCRDTQDMLRARDAEIDRLKKIAEHEKMIKERRQSDGSGRVFTMDDWRDVQNHRLADLPKGFGSPARHSWTDMRPVTAFEEERAQARSYETFLTKTDAWSGAQVIQAVNDLNSEILQFAASATDLCTFEKRPRPAPPRPTQAIHDTAERLGLNLTRILSTRDHTQDPILVQLALQGCISTCIKRAWASFCLGFQPKLDVMLSQIYLTMYKAEPQPTSSKWRSLTHRHIHILHPNLSEYIVNDLAETILRWCQDVLTICGCTNFNTAAFSRDCLRSRFRDQVIRITRAVTKLERVSREDIMSTNFDVVSVDPADGFDPNGMSDAFGEYTTSRGPLLCTMELGLKCTTRRNVAAPGADGQDTMYERRILLQPRVILESVIDVLQEK